MEAIQEAWNPYKLWHRQHLTDGDLRQMEYFFQLDKPFVGGFDTETTGLHIKKDKPFLIIFGWNIPGADYGRVFTFHPTQKAMTLYFKLAKKLKVFMAWNTKYDLHMKTNIGWRYDFPNLVEGIAMARLAVESIPARHGGQSLALKDIGRDIVHPDAANAESKVKEVKKKIQARRVQMLTAALKQFDHPTDRTRKPIRLDTGKSTNLRYAENNPDNVEWKWVPDKWSKKRVEDFLKDIVNEPEDLPEEIAELYQDWLSEFEDNNYEPTYKDIYDEDPEAMIEYAGDDVITMLEFYKKAAPVIVMREQKRTLKRENKLIVPLYKMERTGVRVDRDYLNDSRKKLKSIIKLKRAQMWEIAGQQFSIGQHELIKKIFTQWGIELHKDDKKALKDVSRNHKGTPADSLSKLIRSLRRLEKWYSTYCVRILDNTAYDGRFYTQIAQCSAVSGRVGSDSQQFPKERILTEEGEAYEEEHGAFKAPKEMEIFFPRRAFIPTDRGSVVGWNTIYYLDFSQIELRNQADYTIRVSGGDLQMCRAYMPFKCVHYKTGQEYDYTNPLFRKGWNLKQEDGATSVWLMPDRGMEPWTKTDVHSETTHNALVELGYECLQKYKHYRPSVGMPERNMIFGKELDEKAFEMARYKGKIFNFMKNYGGGMKAAMEQLDLPEVAAKALIAGYEIAFPEVVVYQNAVIRQHSRQGYVTNMYDRRYYIDDNNKAYKLANYLIQGTCADMLKECTILISELLENYNTRMILQVHDEIQFEVWAGEEHLIPQILQIMQGHEWHYVPIVSDVEVAKETWAEKKKVEVEAA
jgi:DNA polymerase I